MMRAIKRSGAPLFRLGIHLSSVSKCKDWIIDCGLFYIAICELAALSPNAVVRIECVHGGASDSRFQPREYRTTIRGDLRDHETRNKNGGLCLG